MSNTIIKGQYNIVDKDGNIKTIHPETSGDKVLIDRSSNASVIPNDVANLQHIVNKMGSLALKSKVETSDFTTGTMIGVAGTGNDPCANLKANTDAGKIADALIVKNIESRVDTLENSNLVTVDELDAGLATKPDTEINDSVTSTSLTWSSKKLSDQLTELNSNSNLLKSRVDTLIALPDGSTTNDARLEDICNGYDNTVYDSPGESVRNQVSDLNDKINNIIDTEYTTSVSIIEPNESIIDSILLKTGDYQTNQYTTNFKINKYDNINVGKYKIHGYTQNNAALYVVKSNDETVIDYKKVNEGLDSSGTYDVDINITQNDCIIYVGGGYSTIPSLSKYDMSTCIKNTVSIDSHISRYANSINPLYGKTLLINGDSIAQGVGGKTINGEKWGFIKYITESNSMILHNYAIGGGCLSMKATEASGRHYICNTIETMQSDADYIIFEGGFNDWWLWHSIGEITNTMSDEIDVYTVYGALESICRQALNKWVGKKIAFIITHKIHAVLSPWGSTHNMSDKYITLNDYYQAIRDVCDKYSIPYCDLSKKSCLNTELEPYRQYVDYNADDPDHLSGVHPNDNGIRTFYVPIIENFLKQL